MTKAGDKLLRSALEARAFARGDCEHDWQPQAKLNTYLCPKCGVRLSLPSNYRPASA